MAEFEDKTHGVTPVPRGKSASDHQMEITGPTTPVTDKYRAGVLEAKKASPSKYLPDEPLPGEVPIDILDGQKKRGAPSTTRPVVVDTAQGVSDKWDQTREKWGRMLEKAEAEKHSAISFKDVVDPEVSRMTELQIASKPLSEVEVGQLAKDMMDGVGAKAEGNLSGFHGQHDAARALSAYTHAMLARPEDRQKIILAMRALHKADPNANPRLGDFPASLSDFASKSFNDRQLAYAEALSGNQLLRATLIALEDSQARDKQFGIKNSPDSEYQVGVDLYSTLWTALSDTNRERALRMFQDRHGGRDISGLREWLGSHISSPADAADKEKK